MVRPGSYHHQFIRHQQLHNEMVALLDKAYHHQVYLMSEETLFNSAPVGYRECNADAWIERMKGTEQGRNHVGASTGTGTYYNTSSLQCMNLVYHRFGLSQQREQMFNMPQQLLASRC